MSNKKNQQISPDQVIKDIKRVADKLKKIPEKHEYFSYGKFKEWQIRKSFGGWVKAISEAGVLSYDDPELNSFNDLRVKYAEQKRISEILRREIQDLKDEALSSSSLKKLIGIEQDEKVIVKKTSWITPKKISSTKGIPILFLSDLHWDEVVTPEQIQGLNKYNREIAIKRIQHTFNTATSLLTEEIKDHVYDGIVLALGGDLFSGNIHEELAETNEARILQSIISLLDQLISGTDLLKSKFKKVYIPCVVGNHGRIHKKPRAKNRVFDNYEWLLYSFLQRHYQNDEDVVVHVSESADCQFSVYEKTILLTHGDQFRGGNGISGIFSPLMLGMSRKQKRNASVKRPFDLMMVGHFHQLIMTPYLVINGSMKGYDEYAFLNNFGFEPAQQALMVIHPVHGITHQMPIQCDNYNKTERFSGDGSKIKSIW